MTDVRELLRRYLRGRSERKTAAGLADRKTARRYVRAAQELGLSVGDDEARLSEPFLAAVAARVRVGAPAVRGSFWALCETHREVLGSWAAEQVPGPKLVELLLRHTGTTVPLRTVQRFVAEELGGAQKPRETLHITDCPPGEELQVDYEELGWAIDPDTGKRRKLHAFVCVAVHSRHMFVYPTWHETMEGTIEALDAAWEFFGGVFKVVIPDNLKAIVRRPDAVNPTIAEVFLEYSQARGFLVDPARVRRPQDKGRVENGVKFTQRDFFGGERLLGLEAWREWARRWCLTRAGMRDHGTTRRKPLEVFEQHERPVLLPAPTQPWDVPTWQLAKVGRDHRIQVKQAFYRLPAGHVHEEMRVRVDRTTVKVYQKNMLLRALLRVEPGQCGGDSEDIPEHQRALVRRDAPALTALAAQHGPHVGEVARRLLSRLPWWGEARKVHRLLKLCLTYGDAATDLACSKALALDVDDVVRIERVLVQALEETLPAALPVGVIRLPKPRFARDAESFRVRPVRPSGAVHAAYVP
ncbi:MAG: IS21 family transposase [Myxococcota bacterium]